MADVTFTPEQVKEMIMNTVSAAVRTPALDAVDEATKKAAAENLAIAAAAEPVTAEKQLVDAKVSTPGAVGTAANMA